MTDPRFHKDTHKSGPERGSRADEDTAKKADGLESTSPQSEFMSLEQFQQEALPNIPPIPGFHVCWLSSTNQYDPIYRRLRLGYVPVTFEDLPQGAGWEQFKVKAGENVGHVSVNEMVAYKIPEEIYQRNMRYVHHTRPQEEQEKLALDMEQMARTMHDSSGQQLLRRESTAESELAQTPFQRQSVPVF